jgi:hypothetical protein
VRAEALPERGKAPAGLALALMRAEAIPERWEAPAGLARRWPVRADGD